MIVVAKENSETEGVREVTGRFARWVQPHRVFAIMGLIFGSALVLIVPPFQVPDELMHFLRAYQISEGQFVPTWIGNDGVGMLPTSISQACQRFDEVRYNRATTSRQAILDALHQVPLKPEIRANYQLINAHYSPVLFLPQAAAIGIGRLLGWPPLMLMYLARLIDLGIWIGVGCIALRIAPSFARPLLLVMLMPMSIFMAASVSPDGLTNAIAFLVTALAICAAVDTNHTDGRFVGWGWIAVYFFSCIALTVAKAAYFPLALLILLIPSSRFGGAKRFAVVLALLIFVSIAALVLWSRLTPGLNLDSYPGNPSVSPHGQLDFLLHNPLSFLQIPIFSAQRDGWLVVLSFVGRLGWLNIQLSPFFVMAYLAALILACRPNAGENDFPKFRRLAPVTFFAAAASTEALLVLIDLVWTSVGSLRVDGLQGRYFIPIAPALLLFIAGIWRTLPSKYRARGSETHRNAITAMITLISCVYTLIVLYFHYYVWAGMNSV